MSKEKKFNFVLGGLVLTVVLIYFVFGRQKNNPALITADRMAALQVSVSDWAKEKGAPPQNLSDLGLPSEALEDHIGNPFTYQISGSEVTISSLGADGKPGGVMFKADRQITFDCLED